MRMLLSIVFNAVALYATAMVVPGITFHGSVVSLLVAGAIFGLFNLIVRPDRKSTRLNSSHSH